MPPWLRSLDRDDLHNFGGSIESERCRRDVLMGKRLRQLLEDAGVSRGSLWLLMIWCAFSHRNIWSAVRVFERNGQNVHLYQYARGPFLSCSCFVLLPKMIFLNENFRFWWLLVSPMKRTSKVTLLHGGIICRNNLSSSRSGDKSWLADHSGFLFATFLPKPTHFIRRPNCPSLWAGFIQFYCNN